MVAQDHRASLRAIFSYAPAPFENIPVLSALVTQPKIDRVAKLLAARGARRRAVED
jgi:hypothetical protein